MGGDPAVAVQDVEGEHRRVVEGDAAPALAGQGDGGDHAGRDQQRQAGEGGRDGGVGVPAEQGGHPGVAAQHPCQARLAELTDPVDHRQVQFDRRVVEGHQGGQLGPPGAESGVQPVQGLLVQQAVAAPRYRRVEHQHVGAGQFVQPVDRPVGRLLPGPLPRRPAEQHRPVRRPAVVVAGAGEHRVPGGQHLRHLLVLLGQAVVGEVSGGQHRVQRAGQGVEVRHHLLGPPPGALSAVPAVDLAEVDVTEVRDRQHADHASDFTTGREPPRGA